jgi:hypothetical protein
MPQSALSLLSGTRVGRFKPSTVPRRFSVAAGFYRTCVIDGLLEHSPAEHVRRPAVPAESPTFGFTHLQFEALLTAARQSAHPCDFALVARLGLLGLRIFDATRADIPGLERRARPPCAARVRQRNQGRPGPASASGRAAHRPGSQRLTPGLVGQDLAGRLARSAMRPRCAGVPKRADIHNQRMSLGDDVGDVHSQRPLTLLRRTDHHRSLPGSSSSIRGVDASPGAIRQPRVPSNPSRVHCWDCAAASLSTRNAHRVAAACTSCRFLLRAVATWAPSCLRTLNRSTRWKISSTSAPAESSRSTRSDPRPASTRSSSSIKSRSSDGSSQRCPSGATASKTACPPISTPAIAAGQAAAVMSRRAASRCSWRTT